MKKITLLIMLFVISFSASSQVVSYSFSQSSGTYTEITGGTVLGAEASDDQRFVDPADLVGASGLNTGLGFPIGFNFVFNGEVYDRFAVNNNGWISLGKSSLGANAVNINSTSNYTPLSSTATTVTNELVARIAPLGRDLQGQVGSTLRFEVSGTAPNQVLTVQWKNYRKFNNTGDSFNFQVKLYETSNVVQTVYGAFVSNTTSSTYQVGLRAAPAATAGNFVARASTTSWATTTAATAATGAVTMVNTNIPASGLTFTWTPPTCPSPTSLVVSNLTSNSATLTWGVPSIVPSAGYEYVYSTTNTVPTAAGTASATNSVGITGLTPATTYYVFTRSNCGSEFGVWTSIGSFTTQCVGVTDFVQNFETTPTGVGNLPVCWSSAGSTGNVYNTTGSVAPMSPANRLYMNISATTTAFATLPPVTNLQAETHRLRFKAYATAAAKKLRVGYFTNPADVSTFVFIEEIDLPSTAATTATEFTVIPYLSAVPGVNNLVFSLVAGTATTVYIDDVKWEYNSSCVEPTALNVLSLTNQTAQLSWANGGAEPQWQVQYGVSGFTLGTGTIVTPVTTNPFTLTGLTANTTYQYYVRGECTGPEFSSWSGPFTFKTLCDGVTAFTENFDTYTSGVNSLPNCWSRAGSSVSTYITTGATTPMTPSNRLYMFANTGTDTYAILPPISNLQAATNRLRFKAFSTASPRDLIVGYMTNPTDVSSFVALQTFTIAGTVIANTQEYVVYPTGVPAGVTTLALKNVGFTGASSTFYIDDVAWELIPACANPTGVSSSAVTSTTASIAWTGNPTDVSWEIEYGAPGFTLGTGTIVPAATNPFTLTSLASSTTFQYYIRSICAGPTTSTNSISGTFTTLCAAFAPPYVQNFATFPALCWTRADAGTIATGPTGTGASAWANDGYLNVGTTGSIKYNLYQGGRIGWMVSPIFNLSAGGYEVKYDVGATVFAGTTSATMGADDAVNFLMSTNGGVTWTSLEVFNTANTPTNVGATKVYNISTVTSANVLFAFRADEGPVDNTEDYDFFVDNFKVDLPAVAAPGCASNVVATQGAGCGNYPLAFSWNATATANGYRINIGTTAGGTDVANNLDLGSALTYTIATPTPGATYYYTVIPYNSVGNATGCTELSFATPVTPCACIPVYTTGVASSDYVSVFALQGTTLNNNSGTSTAAPSYNLYTGQPNYTATLTQGTTYVANASVGFSNQAFSVWIDFNDNANFEASERIGSTTTNVNTPSGTFNITIPCNATVGAHKMRVRMVYAAVGNTIDPCTSATFGEAEDYIVTIAALAAPTGNATQAFCGTATVANLVATGATGATIKWYDAATLGTELPSTTALVTGTSYYASQTVGTCESATRLAVAVTLNPVPATPTGAASQTFCTADGDDLADFVVVGTNLVWYDAATGGNVLPTTTIATATTYYVASNNGTCESPRLAITSTLDCSPAPCLTATNGQWPAGTFNPAPNCDGYIVQQITTCGYASEYSVVAVVTGQTYTFASSIATDIITLSADAGVTSVATGTGTLTWVSTVTGNVRFYTHVAGCTAQSVCRIKTVTCGVITNETPDYANLQFPATLTFAQGGSGTVYGQIYEGGLTDVAPNITGQAPGVTAWVGISPVGSNTNPNTWTTWVPATWNSGHVSNNDEYQATIGATLLPGTYYYATRFRLNSGAYVYGGIDSSNNGNFWNGTVYNSGVLTVTPPPAPANDNCAGAYAVTVNSNLTCTSVAAGTLVGATASTTDATSCFGTEDDDVWFSFVATATSHQISLTNVLGSTTDLFHSLWTGADCASLTLVPGTCSDPNTSTPVGLTIGQTYYIRVYSYTATAGQTSTFNVCIGSFPPPPANDVCSAPVALTAGGIFTDNDIDTTNSGATLSSETPIPTCGALSFATTAKDVWYSVVVPASGSITIETGVTVSGSTGIDTVIAAYTGTCGSLTQAGCDDDGATEATYGLSKLSLTGQTPGATILVRVFGYNGAIGAYSISAYDASLSTDNFDDSNFTFYPNPVKDVLNLSYSENITKVQVINLLGQEVKTNSMDANQAQVDMSNLPTGTYLVKVTANDKVKTIKVIKQ